jgi:glycosyltransferase involved in cell wall biosynthesis
MHLVLLHGYLLHGTGSNIYVANIAKAWCELGHQVTVVCQDRHPQDLPFVREYIGPKAPIPKEPPEPGTTRVVVPFINDLLPVYVFDKYEGYLVKRVPEMTEEEIQAHIEMTAAVLSEVCTQGVDYVLTNHALFGPIIARRALHNTGIPYNVKIHGSSIE